MILLETFLRRDDLYRYVRALLTIITSYIRQTSQYRIQYSNQKEYVL